MTMPALKTKPGILQCISPVDGNIFVERALNTAADADAALARAVKAQAAWRRTPVALRQEIMLKALDYFLAHADEIGLELTKMMGRPARYTPGEIRGGFQERVRYMTEIAPRALADIVPEAREGFKRYVRREPLGVVAIVAPWNYPYLTAANGIFPALLAGNAVVLKHSHQTPLCADRFLAAFRSAGLPEGVFQFLDLSHTDTEAMISDPRIGYVNFTGSVAGGHAVQKAISGKFIAAGLELGGNDPAYVRADADIKFSAENIVDGAYFNSGQCCCGIERIYVHEKVYDDFISAFAETVKGYRLGNPLEAETTLGPLVRLSAAEGLRARIAETVKRGGRALIDETLFPASRAGTAYLAPQALAGVDHGMPLMKEELFGPVAGIMKVKSDEEAIALMNDSEYGLTASIWTKDIEAAERIGQEIETGTVFANRCDYVDPGLCWTGVKNTGRGATLGVVGFECLTRPKSFHLRKP